MGIKHQLKAFLINRGWYNNLKYSSVFRLYERLFKPHIIQQHQSEINFYQSFLSPCHLIFDIGANDGHKTAAFLTLSKQVICCEPDTINIAILKSRFRSQKKRVFIEEVAVTEKEETAEFYIHHPGSAVNTLNPRWKDVLESDQGVKWNEVVAFSSETRVVRTTALDNLIKRYGKPYFIKIDVEGGETRVLAGLHEKIPYLSFECLLPDFKSELLECLRLIEALDPKALFNIAEYEKLLFPAFVDVKHLHQWIHSATIHHFEIVVKMDVAEF